PPPLGGAIVPEGVASPPVAVGVPPPRSTLGDFVSNVSECLSCFSVSCFCLGSFVLVCMVVDGVSPDL
ncbi:hypothetical protein A2U01_0067386, partial [Trifolium medium]|nr:hypothetical protein [Trifolium medium]